MEEQQKLIQKEIFDHISKNDISGLKAKLISFKGTVDFTDENGNYLWFLRFFFITTLLFCIIYFY